MFVFLLFPQFDSLDQDTTDVSLQLEMKNEANTVSVPLWKHLTLYKCPPRMYNILIGVSIRLNDLCVCVYP